MLSDHYLEFSHDMGDTGDRGDLSLWVMLGWGRGRRINRRFGDYLGTKVFCRAGGAGQLSGGFTLDPRR